LFLHLFMSLLYFVLQGLVVSIAGSVMPSLLNMSVVKYTLKVGKRAGYLLAFGIVSVIIIQVNIGAYLSDVLLRNSSYIELLQKIGTFILILISIYFLRLHLKEKEHKEDENISEINTYKHGLIISSMNTFAIPFYFAAGILLSRLNFFEYNIKNSLFFSIGSVLGSLIVYFGYITLASKIEKRLNSLATKMNLILCIITGLAGLGNLLNLIYRNI